MINTWVNFRKICLYATGLQPNNCIKFEIISFTITCNDITF